MPKGFVGPARWTLRTRLIVVLTALLALVCAVVGVVTVIALRGFLVNRLDAQLTAAGGRSANAGGQQPPNGGQDPGAQFLLAPGQS
ncbi:MAG: sensor histidine kinase, partial [Pseudonocardiales bacterium]|nr:sensor histidine kinase [Pseudonocardiales bacterium]